MRRRDWLLGTAALLGAGGRGVASIFPRSLDRFAVGRTHLDELTEAVNKIEAHVLPLLSGGSAVVADGVTDASATIRADLLALSILGGGVYQLPAGVIRAAGLILYSNVHVRGAGIGATVIKAPDGATADVFVGDGFAALTGTNSDGGILRFALSDLTIDGNYANCPSGGYGLRVYGFGYRLSNVVFRFCRQWGIHSEWGLSAGSPAGSDGMEAYLHNVVVHQNRAGGVDWWGPHDSKWTNGSVWENGADTPSTAISVRVRPSGNALQCTHVHVWGTNHKYPWWIEDATLLENCQGEGGSGAQVVVIGSGTQIVGGRYFGIVGVPSYGIELGQSGQPAGAYRINTEILNCESGGLRFTDDAGAGASVDATVYQSSGAAVSGSPSVGTYRTIRVAGGATGGHLYVPDGGIDATGLSVFRGAGLSLAFVVMAAVNHIFTVDAVNNFVQAVNGAKFRAYNDNATTLRGQIDGATGELLLDQRDAAVQIAKLLATGVVNHGMTGVTDAAAFGALALAHAADGGLRVDGLTETVRGLLLRGIATTGSTDHTAGGDAPLYLAASKRSGTGVGVLGAGENLAVLSDNGNARVLWTSEGYQFFTAAAARIVGGATSLALRNAADSADNVLVSDAGAVTIRGNLGVNGAAPARPTITGSRGGNAALASLLTALAAQGYIVDGTSA